MITLHNAKPAEGMTLRGLFQLTGVVMVDPQDKKTLPLPEMVAAAQYGRWMLLNAMGLSRVRRRDEWLDGLYSDSASFWLMSLGGLAGEW